MHIVDRVTVDNATQTSMCGVVDSVRDAEQRAVFCLVKASFRGVVDGAAQASFRGVVDSAYVNTLEHTFF